MFECARFYYNKTAKYLTDKYFKQHSKLIFDAFLLEHFDVEFDYDELTVGNLTEIARQLEIPDKYIPCAYGNIKYLARKCKLPSRTLIRKEVLPTKMNAKHPEYWARDTPQHAKETACFEAYTNYNTALVNYMVRLLINVIKCARDLEELVVPEFSLLQTNSFSLGIKNRTLDFSNDTFMPKIFKNLTYYINPTEKRRVMKLIHGNDSNICESRLVKKIDSYYLCLVVNVKEKPITPKYNICAVDPGVRTFQTVYSPEGITAKLGNGYNKLFVKMSKQVDRYKSSLSKIGVPTPMVLTDSQRLSARRDRRRRYRLKKRIRKTNTKIINRSEELHKKTATYLTRNFKTILIPNTCISNMVRSYKRNICKTTVRGLMSLAHYRFRMRLLQLAKRTKNNVIEVSEAYTSKTCGRCGAIDQELAGKKIYACSCGYTCDRDIHGARNIYLRAIANIWGRSPL